MMGLKKLQKMTLSSVMAVFLVFLFAANLAAQSSGLNYDLRYNNDLSRYGTTGIPRDYYELDDGQSQSSSIIEFNLNYDGDGILGCSGLNLKDLVGFNLNMNDLPQRFGDYLKSNFTTELLARAMTHPLLANVFSEADAFGSFRADYLTQQCNAATVADRAQNIRRQQMMAACAEEHRNQYGGDQEAEARAISECINNPDRQLAALERVRQQNPPISSIEMMQRRLVDSMQCISGPLYPDAASDCQNASYAASMMLRNTSPDGRSAPPAATAADLQSSAKRAPDLMANNLSGAGGNQGVQSGPGAEGNGLTAAMKASDLLDSSTMELITELTESRVNQMLASRKDAGQSNRFAKAFMPASDPFLADVRMNVMSFAQSSDAADRMAAIREEAAEYVFHENHPFLQFMGCRAPDFTEPFFLYYTAMSEVIEEVKTSRENTSSPLPEGVEGIVDAVVDRIETIRENEEILNSTVQFPGITSSEVTGDSPYSSTAYQRMVQFGVPEMQKMVLNAVGCVFNDRMGISPAVFWRMENAGISESEIMAVWAAATNEISFRTTELILRYMKHQMLNIYATVAYDMATSNEGFNVEGGGSSQCEQAQARARSMRDNPDIPDATKQQAVNEADIACEERESPKAGDAESMQFLLEAVKINSDLFENQIEALRIAYEGRLQFSKIMEVVRKRIQENADPGDI